VEIIFNKDNVQYIQAMLTEIVDRKSIRIKKTNGVEDGKELERIQEEVIHFDYLGKIKFLILILKELA